MAGASVPTRGPWPSGEQAVVEVRIGGLVIAGLTAFIIDTYVLEWDCKVKYARLSYTLADVLHLDAIKLATVDATALDIVASFDGSANIVGVAQTLDADIIGTTLVRGNKIQATADSATATEGGMVIWTVGLLPLHP